MAANGFDVHVDEAGDGDRLALCLHGFPELGFSWRHQLIGHDWGAALAWLFAMQRIRPLDKLVIMNVPHPAPFRRELRTLAQLRRSWYILFFQLPWLPEWALGRDRAEAVGDAFRKMAVDKGRFGDEVIDVHRDAADEPGALRAMVNWYRGALLDSRRLRKLGSRSSRPRH